jgi:quercetin dioxygenase-like cupin family protein
MAMKATKPRYRVNFADVPEILIVPNDPNNTAPFRARKIGGAQASLMLADRGPGYHTKPHVHDCEQWNYIVSGEIWFFVEENGYRCKQGDVMRIPRDRPHWAFNRGPGNCVVLECHAPLLIDDPKSEKIVWLLDETEDRAAVTSKRNLFVEFDQQKVDEIEARAFAEEG